MTYTIAECTANKLLMMDRGTVRNVEFHAQNKFAKLMHLVGFIIKKFVMTHGHTKGGRRGNVVLIPSRGRRFVSLNCLDQLQDLPCLLLNMYWGGSFP